MQHAKILGQTIRRPVGLLKEAIDTFSDKSLLLYNWIPTVRVYPAPNTGHQRKKQQARIEHVQHTPQYSQHEVPIPH